ncbi:hypothetical protein B1729_14955 [Microbacterium sp. B35-04]|uniref:hypothetical protein n=1 Tax=unclassified Microbacterium TaxID=2609290 RepID=UPI0013D0A5EA|nr:MULTISPECIES: hypothetical protein [unclassified Microbacterium]KAF2412459.1 hypothetical protein B1729_14955 [Microbacterium sp. B35-04]KAF2417879.1 hypothetical protein B2K11_10895 [Microbacterium sp. B35-30]
MATIDQSHTTTATDSERTATPPEADGRPRRRTLVFWIARYLPAEVAGTAAMVFGGLLASVWTTATPLIALAALVGEIVGFYAVLAVTIYLEQVPVTATRRRALGRTGVLLVAEFGAAELLDTVLVRPAALMLGIWLVPDPVWGMLLGKVAADIVFYAVAAGAFTVTARTGLRDGRRTGRAAGVLT